MRQAVSMRFPILFVLVISVFMGSGAMLLSATSVSASETLVESFDDPLADWKTRFMGLHSNLENYYVTYTGSDDTFRGNNSDGLWLSDGDMASKNSYIRFDSSFGETITSFTIDIGSDRTTATLTIYDVDLNVLVQSAIPLGCSSCGGSNIYHNFSTTSTNGIGGFDITATAFGVEGNVGIDNIVVEASTEIEVDIDIKPGTINCNRENGVIAVAILTTEDFDATTVDHTTVLFEGTSETHVDKKSGEAPRHEEDVDGDGDTDLVFHFRVGETGLTCSSTEGTLIGETFDGQAIEGTDAIRMVGG